MTKKLIEKKYYFYCLLLAFTILMFTSKCSFLYPFNDWVDANAFFTMGKSMMRGVVPYKELFEQKGIILYFIYGIGYLLCHKAFYGVFILEVISFSIFLYYIHKIFSLYLKEKYSIILLPILAYLITTSIAFVHGGSCEEFCLPFFAVTLYYFFKHFKEKELSNKEIIINGVLAGLILMMKYTSLGLWMAFGLFIFIDYLMKHRIKDSFKFCGYFLLGMFIPVLVCFIYLGINGAIDEYIECYFTFNMTVYNDGQDASIIYNIINIPSGAFSSLLKNGMILTSIMCLFPISVFFIKNSDDKKSNNYFRFSIIGTFLITSLVLFWGLKFMTYYILPLFIFIIITLLGICMLLSKYIDRLLDKKYMVILFILVPILFIGLSYMNANYKSMIGSSKKDFFQFKYAKYINKYKNPTLLNMGFLDGGLYTTTGIVPNTRFFEVQNIDYNDYPDNIDSMKRYVINKEIKFILYYSQDDINYIKENKKYILKNYELVYDDEHYFENAVIMHAYLFKLKGLK